MVYVWELSLDCCGLQRALQDGEVRPSVPPTHFPAPPWTKPGGRLTPTACMHVMILPTNGNSLSAHKFKDMLNQSALVLGRSAHRDPPAPGTPCGYTRIIGSGTHGHEHELILGREANAFRFVEELNDEHKTIVLEVIDTWSRP